MSSPTSTVIWRVVGKGAIAGTVGGLLLGVGGRIAMRLVALTAGIGTGFSYGGSAEVVATGLLVGIPAALLYFALRGYLPGPRLLRGLLFGLAYFLVLAIVPPAAARSAVAAVGEIPIVLLTFGTLFAIYGLVVEFIAGRLAREQQPTRGFEGQRRGRK